ncbi:MAG: hypothetical protein GXY92_06940 [Syntrophomonadaceae bacterium]|nr:hypothetical protein [Syntrophomonadaceae bacterium]
MKKRLTVVLACIIVLAFVVGGCADFRLPQSRKEQELPPLVKVELAFRDGTKMQGYMRGLELGEDTTVYLGGQTTTNLYDANGEVAAVFNYAHVLYIKKIDESATPDDALPAETD